jgi:hypothetical protein
MDTALLWRGLLEGSVRWRIMRQYWGMAQGERIASQFLTGIVFLMESRLQVVKKQITG